MTTKSLIVRVGLSLVLAIPASIGLQFLVYVVTYFFIGPWGGALEQPPGQDPIKFDQSLLVVLNLLMIIGPLVIGWSWAGRILVNRSKSRQNESSD